MAILRVARMGNPVLRRAAEQVLPNQLDSDEIQILIEDMLDTVEDYGGAGLAAPQVHALKRIAVICPPGAEDDEHDLAVARQDPGKRGAQLVELGVAAEDAGASRHFESSDAALAAELQLAAARLPPLGPFARLEDVMHEGGGREAVGGR